MSIIKSEHESILKLKHLVFTEITFNRIVGTISDDLRISVSKSVEIEENNCTVILSTSIVAEDQSLSLGVVAKGIFDISECKGNSIIINKNTVAIMFPFIRSQIALITSQPDMAPIIVPALNINSLIDNIDKNTDF